MNEKLAKKYRKVIGGITGVAKAYLSFKPNGEKGFGKQGTQIIVDPNSNHGIYKRVKKARLSAKLLGLHATSAALRKANEQ